MVERARPRDHVHVSAGDRKQRLRDPAEDRFESYLKAHGYAFEHEPELGISKQPDYLIERAGRLAVCEVKGFTTSGIWGQMVASPGQVAHRSMREVLSPVRRQMRAAAKQLKPLAGWNEPLVVVLANPRAAGVDLDPPMVIAAMYGDLEARFTYQEGVGTTSEWVAGRNGRLTQDHPHVSAVVVVRAGDRSADRNRAFTRAYREAHPGAGVDEVLSAIAAAQDSFGAEDPYFSCDVFEAASDVCAPLPPDLFDGPDDARWRPVDGCMKRLL